MNFLRHPALMLLAGALAGFLSGLRTPKVYGVRGALFGFCLSLTALWIQKKGWRWNKLIPGIILGLILFVIPDISSLKGGSLTLLNCTIFIPVYTFCYLQPKFYRVVLLLLPAGALCTAIRIAFFRGDETFTWIDMYEVHFIQGTLLFLALWLVFMWLTDPRFNQQTIKKDPDGNRDLHLRENP
jgi:hypothetical protein